MLLELVNQLNQSDRRTFTATWIKKVCEFVMGETVSDRTFRKWKAIVDVVEYKRDIQYGEALGLCAIAWLKRGNIFRPVNEHEIAQAMQTTTARHFIGDVLSGAISVGLKGKHLPNVIERYTGRRWSRASLYRKIPGYSARKTYYATDIDQILLFFVPVRETNRAA